MTLTEFLLARIAEDEAVALDAARDGEGAIDWAGESGPTDVHIARWDPARILAECEAKRRIVRRHSRTAADHWSGAGNCEGCGFYGDTDLPYTSDSEECPELMDLASIYADHPDYDPAWRP